MWFQKKLRELREKPYQVRLKIMWSAVAVVIILLIGLWMITLHYRQSGTAELKSKIVPIWNNLKQVKQAIDEKR